MKKEIMEKIYRDPKVLDYLRHHPKWYYYLDENPNTVFLSNVPSDTS